MQTKTGSMDGVRRKKRGRLTQSSQVERDDLEDLTVTVSIARLLLAGQRRSIGQLVEAPALAAVYVPIITTYNESASDALDAIRDDIAHRLTGIRDTKETR